MGPAHALTAISGSLGLQDMGGTLTPHRELSGDQGVPMNGWEELSSDLSNGTKYWPGIGIKCSMLQDFQIDENDVELKVKKKTTENLAYCYSKTLVSLTYWGREKN